MILGRFPVPEFGFLLCKRACLPISSQTDSGILWFYDSYNATNHHHPSCLLKLHPDTHMVGHVLLTPFLHPSPFLKETTIKHKNKTNKKQANQPDLAKTRMWLKLRLLYRTILHFTQWSSAAFLIFPVHITPASSLQKPGDSALTLSSSHMARGVAPAPAGRTCRLGQDQPRTKVPSCLS